MDIYLHVPPTDVTKLLPSRGPQPDTAQVFPAQETARHRMLEAWNVCE
jgi:hypothetical protein